MLPRYLIKRNNDLLALVDPIGHLYNDVEPEKAKWAEAMRVVHSSTAQHTPLNMDKVAWRIIPLTYIVCEKDQALPQFVQMMMIQRAGGEGILIKQYRLEASHSPFLSMPEEVANVVQELIASFNSYIYQGGI